MVVTLLPEKDAKEGFTFIFYGPLEKCKKCKLFSACFGNLKSGRKYKVTRVRKIKHTCPLTKDNMIVVDVDLVKINAALPANKCIDGSKIKFKREKCFELACSNYDLCFPEGLKDGDECKVLKVYESLTCKKGKKLKRVTLSLLSP